MEGITTAVLDEFPQLRTNMKHKTMFLGALCFVFYLMGLLLITDVSLSVYLCVFQCVLIFCIPSHVHAVSVFIGRHLLVHSH